MGSWNFGKGHYEKKRVIIFRFGLAVQEQVPAIEKLWEWLHENLQCFLFQI